MTLSRKDAKDVRRDAFTYLRPEFGILGCNLLLLTIILLQYKLQKAHELSFCFLDTEPSVAITGWKMPRVTIGLDSRITFILALWINNNSIHEQDVKSHN